MEDNKIDINELKDTATMYGIKFPGNISKVKLEELITKFKTSTNDVKEVGSAISSDEDDEIYSENLAWNDSKITNGEVKELKEQALMRLKVRVTNLNPEEADSTTVYAGVVSQYFKAARYIPLGAEWYVEQCLVDKLLSDKLQVFINDIDPKTRRPNGNKKAKLVKHYNIEFL